MATPGGEEDLQDYFNEAKDIEDTKQPCSADDEPVTKTPDEGEQEKKWLHDAGYGHLVTRIEEADTGELNPEIITEEVSSLTRTQAAAVIRRVNTLSQTFRRKRDVRSVFPPQEDKVSGMLSPNTAISQIEDATDAQSGVEALTIQATAPGPNVDSIDHSLDEGLFPNSKLTFSDVKNQATDPVDGLQNFVLVRDKFGITRVSDLSEEDVQRIRSLALIELTALFDNYGIQYSARKVKKKYKDAGQFGVPLQTMVDNERRQGQNVRVPTVLTKTVDYLTANCLNEEGILRIPGSAARIKKLRQSIEDNPASFSWDDYNHNDVAALLKQFLRDLPVPILTHDYIEAFAQVEHIPDKKQQLQALNLLIILLPDVHRDSLKLLLSCLRRVVEHHNMNKMNISNVAMIIAPNLFLDQVTKVKAVKDIEINLAASTSNITKSLIKYQDILWTIPSFLVTQIRHQYDSETIKKSKDKTLIKMLKKDKSGKTRPPIQNEADFKAGLIRVNGSSPIQLEENTTAAEVVAKFKGDSKSQERLLKYSDESARLFEKGGNIGERCMDPAANMLESYRVNPNADWLVRDVDSKMDF